MKAMILAAGRGSRMGSLTSNTPKPLLSAGDRSLIEHHLYAMAESGITEVVINVSYRYEQMQQTMGDGSAYGLRISYSYEPELLGTGGGIYQALPLLGKDPFILVSADIWTDYPLNKLPSKLNDLGHLVLVDNPPHHSEGDFGLKNNRVVNGTVPLLNYAGIAILRPELFANCESGYFSLSPLLVGAIDAGEMSGEYYSGTWFNVGTPTELKAVNDRKANGY